jgi:ribosomal protein L37AE/L43A
MKAVAVNIKMRCPRCRNTTHIQLPGEVIQCPFCGRPWFWPYTPIYKQNARGAASYVQSIEASFVDLGTPSIDMQTTPV